MSKDIEAIHREESVLQRLCALLWDMLNLCLGILDPVPLSRWRDDTERLLIHFAGRGYTFSCVLPKKKCTLIPENGLDFRQALQNALILGCSWQPLFREQIVIQEKPYIPHTWWQWAEGVTPNLYDHCTYHAHISPGLIGQIRYEKHSLLGESFTTISTRVTRHLDVKDFDLLIV